MKTIRCVLLVCGITVISAVTLGVIIGVIIDQLSPDVVNGGWSSWGYGELSVCSVTCGVGSRIRYQIRTCSNPTPQNGGKDCGIGNTRISIVSCNRHIKCPVVNGGWSSWGYDQLGVCSVTCGVGSQRRYRIRTCTNPGPKNGGKDCGTRNKRISTVSCNTNIKCPVVKGGWSSWGYGQLGVCSVSCGVGSRRRYQIRTCTNPAPQNGGKDCGTRNKRISTVSCITNITCPESVFGPGLIAVLSVSGVFVIFLVVAAVIFFRLRRRIGKMKSDINERPVSESPNVNDVTRPESAESIAENLYETASLRSPEHFYEELPETQMMLPINAPVGASAPLWYEELLSAQSNDQAA
ncbi:coadhesin-like [Gigantopelta aegis]|uniref:coadhesin-like n=1 Tax=Gigantopelta aegis TaxID=1735272 RepID=UPI001B88D84B|nr:coadhesin-like [Gigantopelta aegis]